MIFDIISVYDMCAIYSISSKISFIFYNLHGMRSNSKLSGTYNINIV